MNKEFGRIVAQIDNDGKQLSLTSNGQLFTSKRRSEVLGRELIVYVSLDSSTAAGYARYRNDRFDENIHGILKRSTDAKPLTPWSTPVDKNGTNVDTPAPDNAREIRRRDVHDIEITAFEPHSARLKAIVDLKHLYRIQQPA